MSKLGIRKKTQHTETNVEGKCIEMTQIEKDIETKWCCRFRPKLYVHIVFVSEKIRFHA